VSPTGRKVWFVVTRVGDRQKRVTIGTYPAISLAEARDEARPPYHSRNRLGLASHRTRGRPALSRFSSFLRSHPARSKLSSKACVSSASRARASAFRRISSRARRSLFINLYAKPKNRSWRACERLLGVFRALADKPLGDITRSDLVRVLDQLIASGTPYRANRALSALKKLMAWALDRAFDRAT
jgi:hypothetical protein